MLIGATIRYSYGPSQSGENFVSDSKENLLLQGYTLCTEKRWGNLLETGYNQLRNHIIRMFILCCVCYCSWSQLLEKLALPIIKWICPTVPTCPVAILGGFPCTAWFDIRELSEDSPGDFEGLDASVALIANLLSTEPADVKLGIGGFSMGVAIALYSATCFAQGKYGNGIDYPVNLRAIVGLSGWLPGSRSLRDKIEGSHEAARHAASLPIFALSRLSLPHQNFEKEEQNEQFFEEVKGLLILGELDLNGVKVK
ncbi:acyl-protein thioesterase 1-like [Camellia sinensis]|uniref:acyl-protein thioesterase 1-like n=1 Tax=Camellia sinensis TaxID=4442 RepID=UPI001035F1B0|nr:acyl-protein thioesterase 1-like [Camellia sinensis]